MKNTTRMASPRMASSRIGVHGVSCENGMVLETKALLLMFAASSISTAMRGATMAPIRSATAMSLRGSFS